MTIAQDKFLQALAKHIVNEPDARKREETLEYIRENQSHVLINQLALKCQQQNSLGISHDKSAFLKFSEADMNDHQRAEHSLLRTFKQSGYELTNLDLLGGSEKIIELIKFYLRSNNNSFDPCAAIDSLCEDFHICMSSIDFHMIAQHLNQCSPSTSLNSTESLQIPSLKDIDLFLMPKKGGNDSLKLIQGKKYFGHKTHEVKEIFDCYQFIPQNAKVDFTFYNYSLKDFLDHQNSSKGPCAHQGWVLIQPISSCELKANTLQCFSTIVDKQENHLTTVHPDRGSFVIDQYQFEQITEPYERKKKVDLLVRILSKILYLNRAQNNESNSRYFEVDTDSLNFLISKAIECYGYLDRFLNSQYGLIEHRYLSINQENNLQQDIVNRMQQAVAYIYQYYISSCSQINNTLIWGTSPSYEDKNSPLLSFTSKLSPSKLSPSKLSPTSREFYPRGISPGGTSPTSDLSPASTWSSSSSTPRKTSPLYLEGHSFSKEKKN